ncbi:class I SAM-dependent methyltransferase [Ruficoccus amylovorans]|uniref:Class I SAM-dependent methyltransferase n=1 Tax=Ruficoccus amylovorans TaxID=1804625 RepID=A0A842HBV5_9BACT|nr:class I SAM-dependent methyltransferase [Ruficoccus amylovorans]MBC2593649.1 class I SAM-dependent methyltransferase [Ruficoccus amylovorans]
MKKRASTAPRLENRHPGFDRVARAYPGLEFIGYGRRLEAGRLAFLDKLRPCRNLLLLGEGNGRFLKNLLLANPDCAATVVEISPRMIACARAALGPELSSRVQWIEASVLDVKLPRAAFDAVVTHYLFDLFEPQGQARLVATGLQALAPGGWWQDTEFLADGPTRLIRLRNRLRLALSYRLLGALCDFPARRLTDHTPLMRAAGLRLADEKDFGHHFAARLWQRPDAG